ncbi:MAG: hypothetical protein KDD51_11320 [Bdellovibrionales bacterium]|nr:hypothetical protein [Bdellovibrionales bacterium]
MTQAVNKPHQPVWFLVGLLWLLGLLLSCIYETRLPSTDVFLFKEAGVRLASAGKLEASNLTHMEFGETRPYAYYPPLYPTLFGVWTKVTGVGLKQSIAFDALLRLLRTLGLIVLLYPAWRGRLRDPRATLGIAGFVLCFSLVSSDGDRPDDLAAVFGLASLWALFRCRYAMGAFLLGCAGATSPAGGVFFALAASFHLLRERRYAPWFAMGAGAALVFVLFNLPVALADPQAFLRFSKQAGISNFPYQVSTAAAFFQSFVAALTHSWNAGWPYIICALTLGFLSLSCRFADSGWMRLSSWVFVLANLCVWTLQPYYLWFSILGFTYYLLRQAVARPAVVLVPLVVAFLPLLFREAKGQLSAFQRTPKQSASYVAAKVLERVGPKKSLAVGSDQYFTFRSQREVANVNYVCPYIDKFDFVYVTPKSSRRDRTELAPFPCHTQRACFEVVADLSPAPVFKILGIKTPYFVRGNGGLLYQNVPCRPVNFAERREF